MVDPRSPSAPSGRRGAATAADAFWARVDASAWSLAAGAAVLVAGIMHFILVPHHMEEARGQGIFFLALGAGQVAWSIAFFRRASRLLVDLGAALAVGVPLCVWILTRFLTPPFGHEPEAVDTIGTATKLAELAAFAFLVVALVGSASSLRTSARPAVVRATVLLAAGLLVGGALFGGGAALGDAIPWLSEGETHGQEGHAHETVNATAPGLVPAWPWLMPPWSS